MHVDAACFAPEERERIAGYNVRLYFLGSGLDISNRVVFFGRFYDLLAKLNRRRNLVRASFTCRRVQLLKCLAGIRAFGFAGFLLRNLCVVLRVLVTHTVDSLIPVYTVLRNRQGGTPQRFL